ncbi:hypothetical protein JW905_10815, partial [bacterium]|nr:hypothetical protein [candidate division CSSED10-310 bacterium]
MPDEIKTNTQVISAYLGE